MGRSKTGTAIVRRQAELLPPATRDDCAALGLSQAQVESLCYLAGQYKTTTPHLVRWIMAGVEPNALGYCLEVRDYVMARTDIRVSPPTVFQCLQRLGFHYPTEVEVPEGRQLLDGHAVSLRELQMAEFQRIVNGVLPDYRPVLLNDGLADVLETFIEVASHIRLYEIDPLSWVLRRLDENGLDIHAAYHLACDDPDGFEELLRGTRDCYGLAMGSLAGYKCGDDGHWSEEGEREEDLENL